MSAKQLSVNVDTNLGDILEAMINDLDVGELVDFVDELIEKVADGDFTNELYELLRDKHEDWLDEMGLSEAEYQSDYADPTIYADVDSEIDDDPEIDLSDDDPDDEPWTTDDDDSDVFDSGD